jgi:tRNA-2-methylthio-N6-dimethylallyladenosine synthase
MILPVTGDLLGRKSLYIKSFGCQMNDHDRLRMVEVLGKDGYDLCPKPEEADLIIVNTCSVRAKSEEKVYSELGRVGLLKERNPELLVGVAGCVAQQVGARLFELVPALDFVLGPDHIASLPGIVERARGARRPGERAAALKIGFEDPREHRFLRAVPHLSAPAATAYVTIQKGCDNNCAYCIVPSVRGPEVSRPEAEILAEVRDLAGAGVREVTLIGQNVNSYRGGHGGAQDFVELLGRVSDVEGIERLRFTTSHPKDFTDELAAAFASVDKLCPWLHLPVQSGSTSVLGRMSRSYSREEYLALVSKVRAACPDVSIGTDVIVGFPGEREEDFQDSIKLLEEVQYDNIYSFMYSVRPGTPAARLEDDVAPEEKRRRLRALQARQADITRVRLARFVSLEVPVLVEGPSRRGGTQLCGRSPGNHVVNFDGGGRSGLVGRVVSVAVTASGAHSLSGELQE